MNAVLYKDGLGQSLTPWSLSCYPHPHVDSPQMVPIPSLGHDNSQEVIIHFIFCEGGSEKLTSSSDDGHEEMRGNDRVVGAFVKIHRTVHHKA